jgi:carboxypeptidase T
MIALLFLLSIDPRYHTFDEVAYELDSIATHYTEITELDTIGYSCFDTLPLFALKISDNVHVDEDEPAILYIGCHHAEEILGIEICMYMIDDLLDNYGIDSARTYWIDNYEIWFVPLMNPEGHSVVMSHMDTIWRKNKRDNNNNGFFDLAYDGVDLNRNYDFYFTEGGSTDPGDEFYRGPYSFSEPEARAIRDLALAQNFTFCNTYHSARYGLTEVVYYPWSSNYGYSPDYPAIRAVADSISNRIVNDQGNGHYNALPGQGLDGRARNWLYGVCGTFTFCIEVSTTCIQPGWMVDDICQRNLAGAYYLLERASQSGITGCIHDYYTGAPLSAEVVITGYYDPNLPPRRSEPIYGRFRRILKPGFYDVEIRRLGYITKTFANVEVADGQMTELNTDLVSLSRETPVSGSQKKITLTPNPAGTMVRIKFDEGISLSSVGVYDMLGRLVTNFDHPVSGMIWQLQDDLDRELAEGVYFLVGQTLSNKVMQKLVVIHR